MKTNRFILHYLCIGLFLLSATDCTRTTSNIHNTSYEISKILKKKNTSNPSVFGRIDEVYPNGTHHPVALAYISVDSQGDTKSTNDGNYLLSVSPGKYDISLRCIGYQPVVVKSVHVSQIDSIKIDFHLTADTTKL